MEKGRRTRCYKQNQNRIFSEIYSTLQIWATIIILQNINWEIQATLLNLDMCNPDFRLNRTDWKVPVPSYANNFYAHNPDRNLGSTSVRIKQSCLHLTTLDISLVAVSLSVDNYYSALSVFS